MLHRRMMLLPLHLRRRNASNDNHQRLDSWGRPCGGLSFCIEVHGDEMIDPAVNLGNLLTIGVVVVGAAGFIWALKGDARVLAQRLSSQDDVLREMKDEVKKIGEVLITLATQNVRLQTIEERQLAQGKRLDDSERRLNAWLDGSHK